MDSVVAVAPRMPTCRTGVEDMRMVVDGVEMGGEERQLETRENLCWMS